MDIQQLSVVLPQYVRLTQSSGETIRRSPLTRQYSDRYFTIVRQHGLRHAQAWLLGSLVTDLHTTPA